MQENTITSDDLPSIYQMADQASLEAQREFIQLTVANMLLLVVGAAIAYASTFWSSSVELAITAALVFMGAAAVNLWLFIRKPVADWYNARAAAESVKTRGWRWMMRAEPYTMTGTDDARRMLLADLRRILEQNSDLSNRISSAGLAGSAIPDKMVRVRQLPLDDRFSVYKKYRIEDQLNWYSQKALYNQRMGKQWIGISIGVNLAAVGLLVYRAANLQARLPIEVVAVIASSSLTWMRVKRFHELAASYGLTAHEITLIDEVESVRSEDELSQFVLDAENAFSREHTQWVARKH